MQDADLDGNGKLDYNEFARMITEKWKTNVWIKGVKYISKRYSHRVNSFIIFLSIEHCEKM
jgi:hypothetical protein